MRLLTKLRQMPSVVHFHRAFSAYRRGEAKRALAHYYRFAHRSSPRPQYEAFEATLLIGSHRSDDARKVFGAVIDQLASSPSLTPSERYVLNYSRYYAALIDKVEADEYRLAALRESADGNGFRWLPLPESAELGGDHWTVTGRGLLRGSDWTKHHKIGGREHRGDLDWFGGFLSGISLERDENLLEEHSFEEVVGWLEAFCSAFPEDQICHSARKVVLRLTSPEGGPELPSQKERELD